MHRLFLSHVVVVLPVSSFRDFRFVHTGRTRTILQVFVVSNIIVYRSQYTDVGWFTLQHAFFLHEFTAVVYVFQKLQKSVHVRQRYDKTKE